jgi:hypothetical protein
MKRRLGFVSNSSSSSFICDVSGHTECGMDMCLSEAEMSQCVNEHTFCNDYKVCRFDELSDDVKQRLAAENKVSYDYDIEVLDEDGKRNYSKSNAARRKDYDEKVLQFIMVNSTEDLLQMFDNEEYDEDVRSGYSLPVEMCPICSFDMVVSDDALKYLEIKNGITVESIKKEIKENFSSYKEFQKYLTQKV